MDTPQPNHSLFEDHPCSQQQGKRLPALQHAWWSRPWIGYLSSLPLVGLALFGDLLWAYRLPHSPYFRTPLFLLAVVVVALFWGAWPALFTLVLSALLLDCFVLSPPGTFGLSLGGGLLHLLTFLLAGAVLALIATQRQVAHRCALLAERDAEMYAGELHDKDTELEQVNQLKDRFFSAISSELKTPMTSLSVSTRLLSYHLPKQAGHPMQQDAPHFLLEKMGKQTERLNALADELLDIIHIHAGNQYLRCTRCDLAEMCEAVIEEQYRLSRRPMALIGSPRPLLINADEERLHRVVTHLVSNAINSSPEESPVEVRLSDLGETAMLSVRDSGQGIPEDQHPHLFEPFYRTASAQISSRPGLGLGLAICKEIVEQHHGHIWFESELGKGSTFVVEIPKR